MINKRYAQEDGLDNYRLIEDWYELIRWCNSDEPLPDEMTD